MHRISFIMLGGIFCLGIFFFFMPHNLLQKEKKVLHIYNWAAYIPADVIQEFEKQENVRVQYDVFGSIEALEAKLLAARSGYDVVFPPAWPTAIFFVKAEAFSEIDFKKIPNYRFVKQKMLQALQQMRPSLRTLDYAIPFLWGTTGLVYNAKLLKKVAPEAPRNSWKLLFDPYWVQKLAPHRVVMLDSPAEVFPDVKLFRSLSLNDTSQEALTKIAKVLFAIRPFIYKFDSSEAIQGLASGDIILAETFSSYANIAKKIAKKTKSAELIYIIPKEGALMWIDTVAIPKDSPNKDLAHKFINFLLQPQIIARITNHNLTANTVPESLPYIQPEIRNDPGIYPPAEVRERLRTESVFNKNYERQSLRLWTKFKTGY